MKGLGRVGTGLTRTAVINLSDLVDHHWSADHRMVTAELEN